MKIAFLTCQKLPNGIKSDTILIKLLSSQNILINIEVWTNELVQWKQYDCIIIRSCWDYHLLPDKFMQLLTYFKNTNIPILNNFETINWNLNKRYLNKLSNSGIKIPPTIFIAKGESISLNQIMHKYLWSDVVIKPVIAASSFGLSKINIKDAKKENTRINNEIQEHDMIIQKFLPEINQNGELSLIFFNSEYSHTVLKKPKQGDFRVQQSLGGKIQLITPPISIINQAYKIINKSNQSSLYARVDGVISNNELLLMELEMIEPALYLEQDKKAPKMFANAIISKLKNL